MRRTNHALPKFTSIDSKQENASNVTKIAIICNNLGIYFDFNDTFQCGSQSLIVYFRRPIHRSKKSTYLSRLLGINSLTPVITQVRKLHVTGTSAGPKRHAVIHRLILPGFCQQSREIVNTLQQAR